MTAAPTNPFDLGTHLIDEHHQAPEFIDQLDADDMRAYHDQCHATGCPDHAHVDDRRDSDA
jgi:hypothetical protein